MADRKISDLTALTTPAAGDYLPIVDISEAAAASKNKRITVEELMRGAPDGTAGAPGFAFESDPNSGIYSPGADQVAISTGGSGRLFVDANGNVGIADSTPQRDAGTTSLAIGDGSKSASVDLYGTVKNYAIYNGGSGQLGVFDLSASTERITLTSAGLVGVGTSSPGRNLHVAGSSATALIESTGSTNADLLIGDGGVRYYGIRGVAGGGSLQIRNDTANTTLATFTSTGLVGIGTTSPVALLQPNGTVSITGGSGASSANGLHLYFDTATNSGTITAFHSGVDNRNLTLDGKTIGFTIAGSERGRWDSSGRLLVGTSSARSNIFNTVAAKLFQVESDGGTAGASLIRSSADGGSPDLVFGKSRSASIGGNTIVQSGDAIGSISFQGNDGSEFVAAASITAEVDGTPGANDMPGRLVFSTTADGASSPTERMRISSTGQAYMVSTYYGATIISTETAGTSVGLIEGKHSGTAGSITGATTSFTVWTNGNVVNTNNSYGAISDIKLKENIVDAGSQWDDIRALQIRKYNFKEGQTHTQIGLVAQEVEMVSPGLVTESPDRDAEGNDLGTVTKSVNYSVLYMKAVKALQEAMERIEQLEAKVAALESA